MRIAIDLRPLQTGHEYRGIGAYLSNVLTRFPFDTSGHKFIFIRYSDSNPIKDFSLPVKNYQEVLMKKPPLNITGARTLIQRFMQKFAQPHFGDTGKPDAYFQPDFLLGFPRGSRGMKKYLVMYDLIPLMFRNTYLTSWRKVLTQPGLGKRRRLRFVGGAWIRERGYKAGIRTVRRADCVICISKSTAQDMHNLLGIAKTKIRTISLAPSIAKSEKIKKPSFSNKISSPFLLYIGGTDERRRLADLVYAFNLINGREYKFDLVFAGRDFSGPLSTMLVKNTEARQAIMDSSYKDQIHLVDFISQEEKGWLFKNAFAFVYPTMYEGFGLPVLEAMATGCPTIAYRNSSLPEIAGKAAILLNDTGAQAIRDAVINLADNPGARSKLVAAGQRQAARFSWERCARETYEVVAKK